MASNLKRKRSASPQSKNSAHVPMPPGFTANSVVGVSGTPGIHGTAPNEPPSLPEKQSRLKQQETFLTKLYTVLGTSEHCQIIRWDASGERIILAHPKQLEEHVLPSVFRQTRLASFYRQLNIYGFSRKSNVDPAIKDHDATVWAHATLNRTSPLELVVGAKRHVTPRKPRKSRHATPPESSTEDQDRGTPDTQSRSSSVAATRGRPAKRPKTGLGPGPAPSDVDVWWHGHGHYPSAAADPSLVPPYPQTCGRCGTRSPSWLKGGNGVFCSVCGQYYVPWSPIPNGAAESPPNHNARCALCGVTDSPKWWLGPMSEIFCDACGIKYSTHRDVAHPLGAAASATSVAAQALSGYNTAPLTHPWPHWPPNPQTSSHVAPDATEKCANCGATDAADSPAWRLGPNRERWCSRCSANYMNSTRLPNGFGTWGAALAPPAWPSSLSMPTSASVVPSSLNKPTSSASVSSSLGIPTSSALGTSRASSLPASKPFGPPAPSAAPEVRCVNCGVNCTALWWKGENDENFCTSCGLYQQQHGTPRPVGNKSKSKSDSAPAALVAPAGVQCANCRVTQTPLWWKMANGENYCNSCRRYYKTSSPETSPTESTKHDPLKTDLVPSAANRPKCCRCGTSQTLLRWMGFDDGNYYCNSCSDYYKMHGRTLPKRASASNASLPQTTCLDCRTTQASVWWRGANGKYCNECGPRHAQDEPRAADTPTTTGDLQAADAIKSAATTSSKEPASLNQSSRETAATNASASPAEPASSDEPASTGEPASSDEPASSGEVPPSVPVSLKAPAPLSAATSPSAAMSSMTPASPSSAASAEPGAASSAAATSSSVPTSAATTSADASALMSAGQIAFATEDATPRALQSSSAPTASNAASGASSPLISAMPASLPAPSLSVVATADPAAPSSTTGSATPEPVGTQCINCGAVESPLLRKGPNDEPYCTKCWLFSTVYGKSQPRALAISGGGALPGEEPECANCGSAGVGLYPNAHGEQFCTPCGVYAYLHGKQRDTVVEQRKPKKGHEAAAKTTFECLFKGCGMCFKLSSTLRQHQTLLHH